MSTNTDTATLGESFARALAAKDFDTVTSLLHPEISFRGLTPRKNWEAETPREVVDNVLTTWFDPNDEIDELVHLESDTFADRQRVGYRFRVHNPDGEYLVEQQAYLEERDGKIGWMRVVCSGFRPLS